MTVAFGVLGAAIGSTTGNWKLGWSIGVVVGGLIEGVGKNNNVSGGKLTDLRISGSAYGADIPRIWGALRVPGNVIWAQMDANGNHLVEHEESQSSGGGKGGLGGGGSSTSYWYSSTFAVAFHNAVFHYPDDTLSTYTWTLKTIYADDQVIWDVAESVHTININIHSGEETQAIDTLISIAEGGSAPAYRGIAYVVFDDMDLRDFGNRVPNISAVWECDQTVHVSDLATDMCKLSNVLSTEYSFTGDCTTEVIDGYIQNGMASGSDVFQEISDVLFYDLVEYDGELHLIKRGQASSFDITDDDVDSGSENPSTEETISVLTELPAKVNITYYDGDTVSGKITYLQKTQSDVRQVEDSFNTLDISTNFVLQTDKAKQIAAARLDYIWSENTQIKLTLSPDFMEIAPTDVFTKNGKRYRVTSENTNLPVSPIEIRAVVDNLTAITQTSTGSTGGTSAGRDRTIYPSDFVVWSGTEIRDSDRLAPGFYVAASGDAGWQGCTIYYSLDAGSTWVVGGFINAKSVLGESATALSNAGAVVETYDATNTVRVTVEAPGILESCNVYENDSGINNAILGTELIAFTSAAVFSGQTFTVSNIKRGGRDSGLPTHAIAEKFVMLTNAVARVTVPESSIGDTVHVKCVSKFQDIIDVTAETVVISTPTPVSSAIGGEIKGGTSGSILFIDSTLKMAQDNAKLFWDDSNNQLQISQTGSAGGIRIGGDVDIYRTAANIGRTPDAFVSDTGIGIGTGSTALVFGVEISLASTSIFKGVNTTASSPTAGAGLTFGSDDNAAMASGDRLGFLLFGGARDASNTFNSSAAITSYTEENWTGSTCAANISFETCPTGSTSRISRLRITASGSALFGTVVNNPGYNIMLGNGNTAFSMGMNRVQANNTAGSKLVIRGGGATDTTGGFTLATDKNGGDVEIRGGISTGTGYSGIKLQPYILGSTGTADNSSSTVFEVSGNVTGGGISFFGGTPVAKQTSGANVTNNVTSGGTNNTIDNWTSLTTYSTDAAAIRNAVYQLARKVKQINDGLRSYGMFT